ncbi:MAG: hypothetical protein CL537_04485 [Alcanivoracaceae bacterium]|nr:hypothetical protein [Alcanivoracaceae bacterium]|tara:strand:- start:585 stop:1178 length:594 start_codon:yes stop_codon:yes gene_type:complete
MRRALLWVVLSLFTGPAFAKGWYTIEVLVFAQNHPVSSEIFPTNRQPAYAPQPVTLGSPELNEQADSDAVGRGAWQFLGEDSAVLQFMMERMEQSGNYRELYHATWRQPVGSKQETQPVYLRGGQTLPTKEGDIPELEGTLHFSESRYVHVDPRLWFNTEVEGERIYVDISESRRLSGFQAYYFDHPMFGMIVRVTR